MRIPRPRSLNGLISIGLVLITLPLLLAIGRAAYQMDRLATESEHLVLQGVQATQRSQELQENIIAMLRNARLYQVIRLLQGRLGLGRQRFEGEVRAEDLDATFIGDSEERPVGERVAGVESEHLRASRHDRDLVSVGA